MNEYFQLSFTDPTLSMVQIFNIFLVLGPMYVSHVLYR